MICITPLVLSAVPDLLSKRRGFPDATAITRPCVVVL